MAIGVAFWKGPKAVTTVVTCTAVLLLGFKSCSGELTSARCAAKPMPCGISVTSTVTLSRPGIEPNSQIRAAPSLEQLPWLAIADMKAADSGNCSRSTTLFAVEGPELEMVSNKCNVCPTGAGSGWSTSLTLKSTAGEISAT